MRTLTLAAFIIWFVGADRVTRLTARRLDPEMKVGWDASSDFGGFVILNWALSAIPAIIVASLAWADIRGIDADLPPLFYALIGNATIWSAVLFFAPRARRRHVSGAPPSPIKSQRWQVAVAALNVVASVLGIIGFILDRLHR